MYTTRTMNNTTPSHLGQNTHYPNTYTPEILDPLPRPKKGKGLDRWLCYEVSCLDPTGKPLVFVLEIVIDAQSDFIIESKSLKLYLNSLNFIKKSKEDLVSLIEKDLNFCLKTNATYILHSIDSESLSRRALDGECIDECALNDHDNLVLEDERVSETLYSHIFRSNCPVTNQPDWASIVVSYSGKKINASSLLTYLVLFRNHQGFHESCVDTIFQDILDLDGMRDLTIVGYFTRRGGIDITPVRTTLDKAPELSLTYRQ